jgi:hypothetical protein
MINSDLLIKGFYSYLIIICLILTILSLPAVSDTISEQLPVLVNGNAPLQVSDPAEYQSLESILDTNRDGMKYYVARPFGYQECTGDSDANLSIIKTYIDWVSGDEAYIRGEIKNLDDKTIDLIVITFNLFDANGDQIGNAYASIDYLEPKKTWKFSTEPIIKPAFKFERYGSIFTGIYS